MKIVLLITAIISLMPFVCSDNSDSLKAPDNTGLVGYWEWVITTGGIANITLTPDSTGYTRTIVITSDSMYLRYRNDTLRWESSFTVDKREWIVNHDSLNAIIISGSEDLIFWFSDEKDSLYLHSNVVDGFSHTYVRFFINEN